MVQDDCTYASKSWSKAEFPVVPHRLFPLDAWREMSRVWASVRRASNETGVDMFIAEHRRTSSGIREVPGSHPPEATNFEFT